MILLNILRRRNCTLAQLEKNIMKFDFKSSLLRLSCAAACLLGIWSETVGAADFLPVQEAFVVSAHVDDLANVKVSWKIADGYHLYKDRFSIHSDEVPISLEKLHLSKGKMVYDSNFSKEMEVYENAVSMVVPQPTAHKDRKITITWQGCADAGLCYPPETTWLRQKVNPDGIGYSVQVLDNAEATAVLNNDTRLPVVETLTLTSQKDLMSISEIERTLASGNLLKIVGLFGLAGLLLAFTPCVLPMVPILSSLIAGQNGPVGRSKGLALSVAYSLGMALVYAVFGVMAGLAGEGLAAALQNPWVLGTFALLLAGMALSMFGLYELQMPSFVQSRATEWSNRFRGGSFFGVFLMGGLSALVVGPCVAAPLAGALVFISQTRDVVLGGMALFAMALGMSVPLLLVGVSAGSLLPRAGAWMERVKQVFGMMLLGVSIWIISPVLPASLHMLLWVVWLLVASALLGFLGTSTHSPAPAPVLARAGGAAAMALAFILLLGAASGGQSVLQPLSHWRTGGLATLGSLTDSTKANALQFEKIKTLSQLEDKLNQARKSGQAIMLDFYANWCVACKELEAFTFSDPGVQTRLRNVRLLQADVTDNSLNDKALMKRFNIFGPPGVLLFDQYGGNEPVQKIIGYQSAPQFVNSLNQAWGNP